MKRKHFLLGSLLSVPFVALAKTSVNFGSGGPFKVAAGEDRFNNKFTYRGNQFYLKVSGKDTDGGVCIFDSSRVQKGGPLLHLHHAQDEWFFVMKGTFTFKIGDKEFQANEGDSIFGPRGIPHAFQQTSDGEGRLMLMYQPAGTMEDFFKEAVAMPAATEEQTKALFEKHGMTLLGKPLEK